MYGSLIMCKYELLVEVGTTLQRYWLYLVSTRFIGDDTSYPCENVLTGREETVPWTKIYRYELVQQRPVM